MERIEAREGRTAENSGFSVYKEASGKLRVMVLFDFWLAVEV
jgi:hypothetical protein